MAFLSVPLLITLPHVQPPTGTVLVLASARSADSIAATTVSLHGRAGWSALGTVSGSIPAAPEQRELLAVPVAVGDYDGVKVGADQQPLAGSVVAGPGEPLLLRLDSGRLISGAPHAGHDQGHLGLGGI